MSINASDEGSLPAGKTCKHCLSFKACVELGVADEAKERCDFVPRLFVERPARSGQPLRGILPA